MRELYSNQNLTRLDAQLKKRYTLIGLLLALLLALAVFSFTRRIQWLTTVAVFLLAACAIFTVELFCLPLVRYRRLLRSALTGRVHTGAFEFKEAEPELSMVDGVACRGLIFLGEPDKHGTREQRYYWDSQLPSPDFQPGEQVRLKYTGKNIVGYER